MQNKSIITFFWHHIKPYKWFYMVMLLAPTVSSFYPSANYYAIKLFLDTIAGQENLTYQLVLLPIVIFMSAQVMLDLVWRISNIAEWKAAPYVRRSILLQSYDYVQHHSYPFFQENFTGAISSKIKGILDGYDKFWAEMHYGLLQKFFKCVVNFCALSLVNTNLGIFVLIWCSFYIPIMYKLSTKLNQLSCLESESKHFIIGQVADKITNIISLFSFASRTRELKALDNNILNDFIPKQVKAYKYNFKTQIVAMCFYFVLFVFIPFYMLHLRIHGLISVGDFAFVFGIALIVADDIWDATVSLQNFTRSMGDLKSALSLVTINQQDLDKFSASPLIVDKAIIEFKNINFGYNKELIFKDMTFSISPGEKVGIVGHSGSGKSTLINLLLRYFKVANGQILIDGQNIDNVTQDSLRQNIAVIPQDTLLFHRTLMENIRYGNQEATEAEVIEASKKAHIHEFITTLPEEYNTYVGERGIKLSGGQRQRVAIARAILKDAPILILDEATSALDSQTERFIQDSLNFLIQDKRKTVLAIAHRLSTLKHMDRIIVLDKGVIIEEGTHTTLIRNKHSLYKKLWKLQEI
ncbi:ABC transporter ATP-binding protein [Candidatus Tisiphia endosymbiont of Nemotelus uliginosus]|uniref:ABC transporter ATP-binding protein n=2 Tax=unclassified Candidatus Tisiphia TaxID=2996318 RepID=UPI0035C888D0